MFGEMKCPKAYRIRDCLQRNGMRFQWTEITRNEDAQLHVGLDSLCDPRFPVLKIGEQTLHAPTLAQIVHAVGWATGPAEQSMTLPSRAAGLACR